MDILFQKRFSVPCQGTSVSSTTQYDWEDIEKELVIFFSFIPQIHSLLCSALCPRRLTLTRHIPDSFVGWLPWGFGQWEASRKVRIARETDRSISSSCPPCFSATSQEPSAFSIAAASWEVVLPPELCLLPSSIILFPSSSTSASVVTSPHYGHSLDASTPLIWSVNTVHTSAGSPFLKAETVVSSSTIVVSWNNSDWIVSFQNLVCIKKLGPQKGAQL